MGQDKTQELLKEKLRGKGLKVTHQRLQVLSVLEENGGRHMTAEDIYELVSVDNPEIGLATVYRTCSFYWICSWWTGLISGMDACGMRSDIC